MYDDIAEFRGFYQTSLGRRVSSLIRRQLCAFWRGGSSLSTACLGYGFPFVDKTMTQIGAGYGHALNGPPLVMAAHFLAGSFAGY